MQKSVLVFQLFLGSYPKPDLEYSEVCHSLFGRLNLGRIHDDIGTSMPSAFPHHYDW